MMPIKNIYWIALTCSLLASCSTQKSESPATEISAAVDIQSQGEAISPKMYGMFLEHLGNADVGDLIDDALWAEMLDDRKFFYPVDTKTELTPPNKRDTTNQWWPLNSLQSVTMDSTNAYVGVHSPKIQTNKNTLEGIVQSGLPVRAGKKYTGRIVLKGTQGVRVSISLKWGGSEEDISMFTVSNLTNQFNKYDFMFEAKADADSARFEISGLGDGEFLVGAVSLMPADNIDGFRTDVIKLLKELNSGIYRWGGNMSSGYDWQDGVGDSDQRPPRYEFAWDALENNDVGTHELVKFAELINVELSLTVNAGLGDAISAGQWVDYVNGSKETAMGKLRAANGHPEPFGIKLWCVGNETYGWWQLGHTDLKSYIIKHNMFAEKMLVADPTIKLIASGATIDEMTITESALKLTGKAVAEYESQADWTGGLLRSGRDISFMSEHFYCAVDQRFDLNVGKYVNIDEPLVDWTRRPANRVLAKAEHYAEYRKRIPGSDKIPVYMDEWAYFTNWVHPNPTLGVAIGYARSLNEMFRHTDLYKMSGFTFGTSCLSFNKTEAIYNASGLMFKLYQSQLGNIPVKITGNAPQPAPKYPVGGDQPTVNAGGDTYPLDVIATLTADGSALVLAVVNPTESEQKLSLQSPNVQFNNNIKRWTIAGSSINARNVVGYEPQISVTENEFELSNSLKVSPVSINIYRYEINQK